MLAGLQALAALIVRRPGWFAALGVVVGLIAILLARDLRFETSFAALLPTDDPAVQEVEAVKARAGGTADLIVAIRRADGQCDVACEVFAEGLAARFQRQAWVARADASYPTELFEARRLLFLGQEQLRGLQEAVEDDVTRAKANATNPLFVDLQDGLPPWEATESFLKREEADAPLSASMASADGRYRFVRVKPRGTSYDMAEGAETLRRAAELVSDARPQDHQLQVRFSGALPVNQEQHQIMTRDLARASVIALVAILLLLTAYTRQIAASLIIALPLLLGIAATLAVTALTVGQLNLVSGFLVTALLGIGVDYGIHLYLRFLENLGQGASRVAAMHGAMVATFPGCLTSALTTFAAFVTMTLSDFRGFSEYGGIAATGVLFTLLTSFLFLPPLAMRLSLVPGRRRPDPLARAGAARGLAWGVVMASVALLIAASHEGLQVRFRTDFKQAVGRDAPEARFQADVVEPAFGGSLNPGVIAVRDLPEARTAEAVVRRHLARPDSEIDRVFSLASLVPEDLEPRREILDEIQEELGRLPRDKLPADAKDKLRTLDTQLAAQPWTLEDVPGRVRRLLQSLDGGLSFVLVWPRRAMALDEEIQAWAHELDQVQADLREAGVEAPILDENRVAARVLARIRRDGPRVVFLGVAAVLVLLLLDFRSLRRAGLVASALGVGMVWMLGAMGALGMDLNVFNIAVLPTVIGIGIDNAVHIMHRYAQEGPGSVGKVLRTTGAASVLASLTTAMGFAATLVAHHEGIATMGRTAVVGFLATLVASTVLFPALLRVLEKR